jgi:hypothetical protein
MPPRKKKESAPPDPDKLVRQAAGTYRTADDRFEVRGGTGSGWFLVDSEQTNDFGQELIQGPFATLDAVRAAIPTSRSSKITAIRPQPAARRETKGRGSKDKAPAPPPPPPPPPSWIDKLPKQDAAEVRRLIGTLERDGVGDAESLVRRDREGVGPEIATRLIERQLAEIIDELPERGREGARELIRRAVEVLTVVGGTPNRDLPGWMLVEVGPEPEPSNRRITIRELPD